LCELEIEGAPDAVAPDEHRRGLQCHRQRECDSGEVATHKTERRNHTRPRIFAFERESVRAVAEPPLDRACELEQIAHAVAAARVVIAETVHFELRRDLPLVLRHSDRRDDAASQIIDRGHAAASGRAMRR
jgi:hypothetical protein